LERDKREERKASTDCLVGIEIDAHAAESRATVVLLHRTSLEAIERSEARKRWVVVPVSVPERARDGRSPGTEDALPAVLVGVDTKGAVEKLLGGGSKLVVELTVGLLAHPVLRTLDVEPDHAELDVLGFHVVVELSDLLGRIAALGAREHVEVDVLHASRPGLLDRRGAVGINVAKGLVAADDGEVDAVVLVEAVPRGLRIVVGAVDTVSSGLSCKNNKSKSKHEAVHVTNVLKKERKSKN